MQDRQHRAVGDRVEELVRVPGGGERAGLGLAVADHAGDDQVGVVEHRAERVAERVAQLAAFVDRARASRARRGSGMPPGNENCMNSFRSPASSWLMFGIDLAVGAFEIGVADHRRAAVAGAGDVDHVEVVLLDDPVQMHVDEILPRRRAPVAEQHVLDVARAPAAASAADCRRDRSGRPTGSWRRASRHRSAEAVRA